MSAPQRGGESRGGRSCGYCWGREPDALKCTCRGDFCQSKYCPYGFPFRATGKFFVKKPQPAASK